MRTIRARGAGGRMRYLAAGATLSLLCAAARGDPPADAPAGALANFRWALAHAGTAPIKARIAVTSMTRDGEGKDADENPGAAQVQIEDSDAGLRMIYAREALRQAGAEEIAHATDPKARTPTINGMEALKPKAVVDLLSPQIRFQQLLDRASLASTAAQPWDGHPASLLTFTLARPKMAGKEADFIKNFEGRLEVWIGADGAPLAARVHEMFSGRAYLVFSFSVADDEDLAFGHLGDRWVVLHSVTRTRSSGTAGEQEQKVALDLTPLD